MKIKEDIQDRLKVRFVELSLDVVSGKTTPLKAISDLVLFQSILIDMSHKEYLEEKSKMEKIIKNKIYSNERLSETELEHLLGCPF